MTTMESPAAIASRLTGASLPRSEPSSTTLTTAFGHRLPSSTHALQVQGRPLASDPFLFEKQQTFNRAKIVERMVHPCGSGAFGYFEVRRDVSAWTRARFLTGRVGQRTPVFARFSTVTCGREFPDSTRNPRGFALKFYTEDGNYDLVGLNWPVFFVRDPMKGPDVIRSLQRDPATFLCNYDAWFDFLAANPEALHAGAMLFTDSATPRGWRHMNGFGCHTFQWVNVDGDAVYVKYHFVADAGRQCFTQAQAELMCGRDPDYAKRDLWEAIRAGRPATWTAHVQIMTPAEAAQCPFDPFDPTKVWPHGQWPLHEFGRLVLDRNPENYHRDVEQAAFSPGNLVPGIEPSPDPLLNWRLFFYRDAQYHRLGVNHHQIPVNCPFLAGVACPQTRDGLGRADRNGAGLPAYATAERNPPDPAADYRPVRLEAGAVLGRVPSSRHEGQPSEYDQVRVFVRDVLDADGRSHLFANTAYCLSRCLESIQERYLEQLARIDGGYADGVRQAMQELQPRPTADDMYDQVCKLVPSALAGSSRASR